MSATLSLRIETRLEELERITEAVEEFGAQEEWPPALIFHVNLALEELGVNIMNHGYDEGIHEFDITLVSADDAVTIEIVDDGRPFDPLHDPKEPDVDAAIDERPIGGLGVFFVREMMDEMRYRREDGKNRLTLVSRR